MSYKLKNKQELNLIDILVTFKQGSASEHITIDLIFWWLENFEIYYVYSDFQDGKYRPQPSLFEQTWIQKYSNDLDTTS